ncbi:peroxidase 7-like [Humulus lupulus]|uniref:peroxidase 7-like n=1 Tax=Humulus lupulus TaxID=3486 RepID=UPI002B40FC48|nr:peroxidase 7-like [Humulus lupulus]
MNRFISFSIFLLGIIHVVSLSSAFSKSAAFLREEQKDLLDLIPAATTSSFNKYDEDQDSSPHDYNDQPLQGIFSLTLPSLLSHHHTKHSDEDYEDYSLSYNYYYESCPDLEYIVNRKVREWIAKDNTFAPALLRLHFHDCAVRGCDASILLNDERSERTATTSKTLRGFEVIDDIKSELEKKCPKTVSCADILTAAARDATVQAGGQYWTVDFGRKDGLISIAKEAESLVPMGRESITDLIEFFQSLGLDNDDLVSLSGAHTIGRASCESIQYRLFNYSLTESLDRTIDPNYADYLGRKCRWSTDLYVELDSETPTKFDNEYYNNLINRKTGVLSTDQRLYSDSRTLYIVQTLAKNSYTFNQQFQKSMKKLGNVQVLTGPSKGEIRDNCNFVNAGRY